MRFKNFFLISTISNVWPIKPRLLIEKFLKQRAARFSAQYMSSCEKRGVAISAPSKKILHWATLCFSEQEYFKDWVSTILNELQTLWIIRVST